MRIVFASAHYNDTIGYSKVVYEILKRLVKVPEFEVYHFGWRQHPIFRREKIIGLKNDYVAYKSDTPISPPLRGFGEEKLQKYLTITKPDLVILFEEASTLAFLSDICNIPNRKFKIWCYIDQVYTHSNISNIKCEKFIVFSEQWRMPINKEQIVLLQPPSDTIKPVSNDECLALREKLNITDEPIFLSVAKNNPRKRLDLLIQAFTIYKANGGDGKLILITNPDGFYNLQVLFGLENAPMEHIRVVENNLSDETINLFLNTADYGVNTSDGEGWGIMACEMALLGKPQLALDLGAYRTWLNDDTAVLLKPTMRIYKQYSNANGAYGLTTSPEAFAEGFRLVQNKLKPTVDFTWDSVIDGFVKEITHQQVQNS